jgi:hypothetical protein
MNHENIRIETPPSVDTLKEHHAYETVDRVGNDPETTDFKRTARLLQSLWRGSKDFPIGSEPMKPKDDRPSRPLGSRIDLSFARETGSNFLSDAVRDAVRYRLSHRQPHEMIDEDRLYCDLLSSMPLCFNLFGELAADLALADKAVHTWWPDTPGKVTSVEFEWSPGRRLTGEYLENRSAFDIALIMDVGAGKKAVLGIETKYHEHCKAESRPGDERIRRYAEVTTESGIMSQETMESIPGTELQQIWLDHLLALSMLQHPSNEWAWAKFVLVHPERNPSYERAAERYRSLLSRPETFEVRTIESLLDAGVLPETLSEAFRQRYLW